MDENAYLAAMKKQLKESIEQENQANKEMSDIRAEKDYHCKYLYSVKVEIEGIESLCAQALNVSHQLHRNFTKRMKDFQDAFATSLNDIDSMLLDYESERKIEHAMVLETIQKFKDIPKTLSDEVFANKIEEIQVKTEALKHKVQQVTKTLADLNKKRNAENSNSHYENLLKFNEEIKMIILKRNLLLIRKNSC